jgi:hypothetical protein
MATTTPPVPINMAAHRAEWAARADWPTGGPHLVAFIPDRPDDTLGDYWIAFREGLRAAAGQLGYDLAAAEATDDGFRAWRATPSYLVLPEAR